MSSYGGKIAIVHLTFLTILHALQPIAKNAHKISIQRLLDMCDKDRAISRTNAEWVLALAEAYKEHAPKVDGPIKYAEDLEVCKDLVRAANVKHAEYTNERRRGNITFVNFQ